MQKNKIDLSFRAFAGRRNGADYDKPFEAILIMVEGYYHRLRAGFWIRCVMAARVCLTSRCSSPIFSQGNRSSMTIRNRFCKIQWSWSGPVGKMILQGNGKYTEQSRLIQK